jgi:transcriptional regulator GlxA family with amidase domain
VPSARRLLEDSAMALLTAAVRCGFGCFDTDGRAFCRRLGTTPHEYRLRFQP